MYSNHPVYTYKPSIRLSDKESSETFFMPDGECCQPGSVKGAISYGYLNGQEVTLLEFRADEEEYRWVFDTYVSSTARDMILLGIKNQPGYRDQFRQPAVPAKGIDQDQLSALLSKAFGEHEIVSLGDGEKTLHSWEKNTKVVVKEKLPAEFATFARKCDFLKLSKTKTKDSIAVTAPVGSAYLGNLKLVTILQDYIAGRLGTQADYSLAVEKINLMPSKPTILSTNRTLEKPAVTRNLAEILEEIRQPLSPEAMRKKLRFMKAGRDEFTAMKADELKAKMEPDYLRKVEKTFWRKDDVLKCMRWHLRGLSQDDAILKVTIDNESSTMFVERANASKAFDR